MAMADSSDPWRIPSLAPARGEHVAGGVANGLDPIVRRRVGASAR